MLLVLSGKGGVGKSTISTQLALALKESGFRVSIRVVPQVPKIRRDNFSSNNYRLDIP